MNTTFTPEFVYSPFFSGGVVSVSPIVDETSLWLGDAQLKLQEIVALEAGWDSYDSPPITFEALSKSARILEFFSQLGMRSPYVFPVSGGGIQLEWQNSACELEIEVLPNGSLLFLIVDENEEDLEGVISPDYSPQLLRLVTWFTNRKSIYDYL